MKTAMQELKDNSLFTEGEEYIQIVLKKTEWVELFEKEKEQIIDAYYGNIDGVYEYRKAGEEYYNQTYKPETNNL